jgi:hypothetical protein
MSDATAAPSTEAPKPGPPLPLEVLPANFRKHVDPKAPLPLRMMGAKGLVPMGAKEMTTALFMLSADADAGVREAAAKTAAGLPDKILSFALRDDALDAQVLGYFARTLSTREQYIEMIVLNAASADETIALVAATAAERILEIVAQNQLRFLRHPPIVRALAQNPALRPSTLDSVTDFCVRSGLVLEDLPAFRDARRRVLGAGSDEKAAEAAAAREIAEAAAEEVLEKLGAARPDPGEPALPEDAPLPPPEDDAAVGADGRRITLGQQISRLSVSKRIEWAHKKGNKEVRTLLLRDPNRLVQMAVVQSPRITEDEIIKLSNSRTAPEDVLRHIYNNRQLLKSYRVRVALVNNPKVPVAVGMRFLSQLRASELKAVAKNKNVSHGLSAAARNLSEKKGS